jgi:hypothetical protein
MATLVQANNIGDPQATIQHETEPSQLKDSNDPPAQEGLASTSSLISAPQKPTTASNRLKYRNLDWDANKAEIIRLYLEDDRSLQETMCIMKEIHGFEAT